MRRALPLLLACCLPVFRAAADPDERDGMPESLPASGKVSGTLFPGPGRRMSFAVLGDYGYIGSGAEAVSGMIRSWEPRFIVTTGDNTYGPVDYADLHPELPGMQTGWDEYVGRYYGEWIQRRGDGRYATLTGNRQRFFPSVGNHDHTLLSGEFTTLTPPPPIEGYLDFFFSNPGGAPRLPVDRGAVHDHQTSSYALRKGVVDFFMLDSNQPFVTDGTGAARLQSQSDWLEREAAASDAPWKIAVFHHPPPRPWQSPWPWIPAARITRCHLILAGHYHVYERYPWNGVPVLVTGNGGAPLQFRPSPFYPDTQAVEDRRFGALKVQAGADYLEFESRALEAATGEEVLTDRVVLGDAGAVPDRDDEYSFHAVDGQTVALETVTPEGALDPALTLYGPDGRVAARDANGAADGRNARLSCAISATGRWKVRVMAESDVPGGYLVQARLTSPGPDFTGWLAGRSRKESGLPDDADGDGVPDVVTYALTPHGVEPNGGGLRVTAVAGASVVRLTAPQPMRQGVTLAVETATTLQGVWTAVLERRPFGAWRSPAGLTISTGPATDGLQWIQVVIGGGTKRFYRLRSSVDD
jgi:diadenosine tetraphosphatase ApaH/serine/threonine PP2A family protein phosphatase